MKTEIPFTEEESALVARVIRTFHENVTHRASSGVDAVLNSALEAWARKPPPEDVKLFQSMGVLPSTYDSLTRVKLVQIMAVLNRVFGQVGDKSWGTTPSPDPVLPIDVQAGIVMKYAQEGLRLAQAKGATSPEDLAEYANAALKANEKQIDRDRITFATERCERLERVVDDLFMEAGFTVNAVRQYVANLTKMGTALIVGPCEEPVVQLKLTGEKDTVAYKPDITKALRFFVPSTMDVYPSPGAIEAVDADLCIRVRYNKEALARAAGAKTTGAWRPAVIRKILTDYPGVDIGSQTMTDGREKAAQLGEISGTTKKYEGVRWFGLASGQELIALGINTDGISEINPESYYEAETVVLANRVIYAKVCDPAVGRPVVKTTFYGDSSQFFGWPPALQIDNCQKLMNIAMAALKKQLQLAGLVPLVVNDYSSFVDADRPGAFALTPGKVYLRNQNAFSLQGGQQGAAIQPVNLPNIIREIIALFEAIAKLCDDASGFNRNMLGSGNFAGAARALADYEKVLTPSGEIEISRLKVGDKVLNTYSGVSSVTGVYPQGERDILRMFFSNGEHVDCDPEHRWTVSDHPDRPTSWKTMTAQQIIDAGLFRKTIVGKKNPKGFRPKWSLPYVESLGYAHTAVPIDPYTLGALIGNGDKRCRLCVFDNEVFERVPYELGVADTSNCGKASTRTVMGIKTEYHGLGLGVHGLDKFIPESYLRNSKVVRLELLRGLMDTDGCASENGDHVFYSTSSWRLAEDFVTLVKSLGATSVSLRSEAGGEDSIKGRSIRRVRNYRICFNLDRERVFWLDRKQSRVHTRPRVRVYITGVELTGRHTATCITVDSKDSLFLCANYIPTHNTATGLMQIQEAASIIATFVIGNIDATGIVPLLDKVVAWINHNHPDKRVKGDAQIVARGQLSKVMKSAQQQVISAGFQATQTGVMPQLLGPEKLLVAFREYMKSIDFPNADKIIPDEERQAFLATMADAERSADLLVKASQGEQAAQGGQPQQGAQPTQAQPTQAQPQQGMKQAGMGRESGVEARRGAA